MLACLRTRRRLRRRGLPGARRSRRVVRPAGVHDGRPARRERPREPRPRAQRDPQLRLRVPAASHHGQPGAGRRAQGRRRRSICPIALGILAAQGVVERRDIADVVLLGELSLDGAIQPARGVLPIAAAARRERLAGAPAAARRTRARRRSSPGLRALPVSLARRGRRGAERSRRRPRRAAPDRRRRPPTRDATRDLADVRGQPLARRALEIAAAGGHNLLLVGPPGAGKTMMARRLPGILPPLTFDEALEVTAIHSVAGLLPPGTGCCAERPFRAPHHTISDVALVGGGQHAAAGRGQPRASRRAVSRRDARVQPARARGAAAAARRRLASASRAPRGRPSSRRASCWSAR